MLTLSNQNCLQQRSTIPKLHIGFFLIQHPILFIELMAQFHRQIRYSYYVPDPQSSPLFDAVIQDFLLMPLQVLYPFRP